LVTYKERTRLQRSWPWWRWILTGLITLALFLSAIMSWHYLNGGSMVGCGGGSPCEQVLNSRWSNLAGVLPVSGLAVGAYLALLVASFYIGPATEESIRRLAWRAMLVLVGSVAGSAVWFTIIQKWFIGDFCPYCMTTHITGLLLTALVIWRAITQSDYYINDIPLTNHTMKKNVSQTTPGRILRPLTAMGLALTGLALAGILAAFQVIITPSTVYSDGKSQDSLPAIDYHNAPLIGSPDAPYVVTLLFDYQCSHCQKIHLMLDEAVHRYAGKLAFVLCPTPLNTHCNPYVPRDVDAFKNSCELAKIGLAVWVTNRKALPAFDNWMFTFESGDSWRPRSLESARAKAVELVGQEQFDAAWTNPWIGGYMQNCMQIFGQTLMNGKGGVPKLIFGSRWVIPEQYNADDLMMILQNSLAVPKP
jgi:uncharacterized membrane protein/thiol-disulfide isomerase/thioredoxin